MWWTFWAKEDRFESSTKWSLLADTLQGCIPLLQSLRQCQRTGNLSSKNQMPLHGILVVEIFNMWGIDFMGPFPPSSGYVYILLAVDYMSKWVEAIPTRTNDNKVLCKFLKEVIFARFGTSRAIISDGGSH